MSEFLTVPQLAEKYNVEGRNCESAFYRIISKWILSNRLEEGTHYRYTPPVRPGIHPRVFLEKRIVQLILDSESPFCASLRMEHIRTMRSIVPRE